MPVAVRATLSTKKLQEMSGQSRRKIQSIRSEIDSAIGYELRRCAAEEFDKLSRRGSGADGRKWADDKPETKKRKKTNLIGVETGEMQRSLTSSVNNRGVRVEYTAEYAQYFDENRKLLPDKLPMTWENRVTKAAQRVIDNRLR